MFILVLLALGVYGITVFANGSTTGVNVSGKLDITENGIYDISDKEYVDVDVAVPDNYVDPDGTLLLSSNGLYNVETYESVNVNIDTDVILDVEELPYIGYKGTTIPSSGFIENIYVNLNLSNDDIITYVENLNFIDLAGMFFYPILCNESKNFILGIVKQDDVYILTDLYMLLTNNMDLNKFYGLFGSGQSFDESVSELGFSGWNPSFNGIINLNDNVISYDEELFTEFNLSSDYVVGCENSVISSLVSISDFEFIESDFKIDILYRCDDILYCFLDNKWKKILTEDDLNDLNIVVKQIYDGIILSEEDCKEMYNADLCYVIYKSDLDYIIPMIHKAYENSMYLMTFGNSAASGLIYTLVTNEDSSIVVDFSVKDIFSSDHLKIHFQISSSAWVEGDGYFYYVEERIPNYKVYGDIYGSLLYDGMPDSISSVAILDIKLFNISYISNNNYKFMFITKEKPTEDVILHVVLSSCQDDLM